MDVYIAGPFNKRRELKEIRQRLFERGIGSTSSWIDSHLEEFDCMTPESKWKEAKQDLLDVHRADGMVFCNLGQSTSGGMHLEMGFALAKGKPIWLLGEPTSIFHFHPSIAHIKDISEIPNLVRSQGN